MTFYLNLKLKYKESDHSGSFFNLSKNDSDYYN